MPKSKFSAFLSLLLVFLSGAVVGALSYRLYMVKTVYTTTVQPPRRADPEEVRRRIVADLKTKVHIDDQQVTALNKLMDETRDAWQQMRHKMDQDGRAIHEQQWQNFRNTLRADQQPLFDQWKSDRDAEMRKRREQQDHKGPGGPPRP
jgi:uncharacterized membrane protein